MDLDDLLDQLEAEEQQLHIETCSARDLTAGPRRIATPTRSWAVDQDAFARLCRTCRAPAEYLETLPADLSAQLLNYHLHAAQDLDALLTIVGRGPNFLAIQSSTLLQLPTADVVRAAVAGLPDQAVHVHQCKASPALVQVDLVCSATEYEARPGDVQAAGLRIVHSPLGLHATQIDAFLLRLVCQNGLTHRECFGRHGARTRRLSADHPEARALQAAQISRLAREAWKSLTDRWQAIQALTEERLEVEPLFRQWLVRARLSARRVLPLLQGAWERDGGDGTAYAALNALTWVASHADELSLAERRGLARLAGVLAFRHQHLCPRCFSVIPAGAVSTMAPALAE